MYRQIYADRMIRINYMISAFDEDRDENFYFAGESHDFWELVYVDDGEVVATADERVYYLSRGMLLFHKPMEFHRLYANGKKSHIKVISFGAAGSLMKQFENRCFSLNLPEQEAYTEAVKYFIKAYLADCSSQQEEFCDYFNTAVTLMEAFLLRIKNQKEYQRGRLSYSEEMFQKIAGFMKGHCESPLSVNAIAEQLNMSASNVKRIFALYSDIGIAKYFLNLRLRRARELLESGISAAHTAKQLGFNESYFYTVFKHETGMTPLEYVRLKKDRSENRIF